MAKRKDAVETFIALVAILVLLGPFWAMRACAAEPGEGKYCSIERTLDYLKAGGDAWLWVPLAFLVLFAIGVFDEDRNDKDNKDREDR